MVKTCSDQSIIQILTLWSRLTWSDFEHCTLWSQRQANTFIAYTVFLPKNNEIYMAEIESRKPTKEFVVQYFVKSLNTWIRFDGIKKRGKFSEEQTFWGRDTTERKKIL